MRCYFAFCFIFELFLLSHSLHSKLTKSKFIEHCKVLGINCYTLYNSDTKILSQSTDVLDDNLFKNLQPLEFPFRINSPGRRVYINPTLTTVTYNPIKCDPQNYSPTFVYSVGGLYAKSCLYSIAQTGIGKSVSGYEYLNAGCTVPTFSKQSGGLTLFVADKLIINNNEIFYISSSNFGTNSYCTEKGWSYTAHKEFVTILAKSYSIEYSTTFQSFSDKYGSVIVPSDLNLPLLLERDIYDVNIVFGSFKYVCGYLPDYQAYYEINIFPPPGCSSYVGFNATHDICYDLYIGLSVCPTSWFRPTNFLSHNPIVIPVLPSDANAASMLSAFRLLSDKLTELSNGLSLDIKELLTVLVGGSVSPNTTINLDNLAEILNSTNYVNYLNFNSSYFSLVDYLLEGMGKNDDQVQGLIGNWISNIFKALIDPFVKAWLAAISALWTEIAKILIVIITDLADAFINFLVSLADLLIKLVELLLPVLGKLVNSLIDLLTLIVKIIFLMFVKLEQQFWLVEFLILFALLNIYLINSIDVTLLISFLIACITGFQRHPGADSWFLRLINPEYQKFFNSTMS